MKDKKYNIDPYGAYSIPEILREGLLPMVKTRHVLMNLVDDGEIKAIKTGKGTGSSYYFSGIHLIKYLDKFHKE